MHYPPLGICARFSGKRMKTAICNRHHPAIATGPIINGAAAQIPAY
jgi:hypothetical protein